MPFREGHLRSKRKREVSGVKHTNVRSQQRRSRVVANDLSRIKSDRSVGPDAAATYVIGPLDRPTITLQVFPLNLTEKLLTLMRELGVPLNAANHCFSILLPGRFWASKFAKYTVEFFGVRVVDVDGLGACTVFRYEPFGTILIWRRRIFYQADNFWSPPNMVLSAAEPSKAFAEALWQPKQKEKLSIKGIEHATKIEESALVGHGLRLLHEIAKQPLAPGRPRGTGYLKAKEFPDALWEVLTGFASEPSEPQFLQRLSKHQSWKGKTLSLDDARRRTKTLRNWLSRCDPPLNWNAVLAAYRTLKSGK